MKLYRWVAGTLVFLCYGLAQADNNSWVLKRDVVLRQSAGDNGASMRELKAQTPVTRLGKQRGAWTQVKTSNGETGWIHLFDLTNAPAAESPPSATNLVRSLGAIGQSASGSKTGTTVAGIRGLESEDLAKAQPNLKELKQAEDARLSAADAERFAKQAQLQVRSVEDLPATTKP